MSACGQTEEDGPPEEMGAPTRELYEPKAVGKVVRVLTVLAYLLSVSLAAILLSVYYICVWKPTDMALNETTVTSHSARRADMYDYVHGEPFNISRGGNTTMSNTTTNPVPTDMDTYTDTSGSDVANITTESTSSILEYDYNSTNFYDNATTATDNVT